MNRGLLAIGATIVALALPAAAAANPQYWGGPIEDLPTASITYKVNSHGAVKDVRYLVKLKCRYKGGEPGANSRLSSGFYRPKTTATGFKDKTKKPFGAGQGFIAQKIEGNVIGTAANGFLKAKLRYPDPRHGDRIRICHTNKQNWKAAPMRFGDWKDLRDGPFQRGSSAAVIP